MKIHEQLRIIRAFQNQIPVNLDGLTKALGIDLAYDTLDPEISGMIEKIDPDNDEYSNYRITINQADSKNRQRFTLAHEIGHYMLHRNLIGDGLDDTKAYRSTEAGRYYNKRIGSEQETEANRFAAMIVYPRSILEDFKSSDESLSIKELAEKFGVSETSMKIVWESLE